MENLYSNCRQAVCPYTSSSTNMPIPRSLEGSFPPKRFFGSSVIATALLIPSTNYKWYWKAVICRVLKIPPSNKDRSSCCCGSLTVGAGGGSRRGHQCVAGGAGADLGGRALGGRAQAARGGGMPGSAGRSGRAALESPCRTGKAQGCRAWLGGPVTWAHGSCVWWGLPPQRPEIA